MAFAIVGPIYGVSMIAQGKLKQLADQAISTTTADMTFPTLGIPGGSTPLASPIPGVGFWAFVEIFCKAITNAPTQLAGTPQSADDSTFATNLVTYPQYTMANRAGLVIANTCLFLTLKNMLRAQANWRLRDNLTTAVNSTATVDTQIYVT